jgi:hypothetical protein
MLDLADVQVALWADPSGLFHIDASCPLAAENGSWREFPTAALDDTCSLCQQRVLNVRFTGATSAVAAATLAVCSDVVSSSIAQAALGDMNALLRANHALVIAATSARELGVDSPLRRTRTSLAELCILHKTSFEQALAERVLVASPLAPLSTTPPPSTRSAWRAIRWAFRFGVQPERLADRTGLDKDISDVFISDIRRAAALLCSDEQHLLLASATSASGLPSGAFVEVLASSGALGDFLGAASATILPKRVVELLAVASPGLRVEDAGALDASEFNSPLPALTAQLWRPDAGELSSARVALHVARGLLS